MEKLLIDNFEGNKKLDAILNLLIDVRANQELLSVLFRTISLQNLTKEQKDGSDIAWENDFVEERHNILRSLAEKYNLAEDFFSRNN